MWPQVNQPISVPFETSIRRDLIESYVSTPSGAEHEAIIQQLNEGILFDNIFLPFLIHWFVTNVQI